MIYLAAQHHNKRGFTVLEVVMTLLLVGLLMSVAIPSLNAVAGVELRRTASTFQGLMRDTYARAAVSGEAHRIVFDIDERAYWVERTEGSAALKRVQLRPDQDGRIEFDVVDERIERIVDSTRVEDQEKIRLFSGPKWEAVEDEFGKPQRLHPELKIFSIWTDNLTERVSAGKIALHFFPGGYVQEAQVVLTDDDLGSRTLTVSTNPLTGETFVDDEIPRLPL